jgi:hypothetical protein
MKGIYNFVNNILWTGKTKRLKEAKEEAQAEIEIFRKEQEKEFQDYQKDVSKIWGFCVHISRIYIRSQLPRSVHPLGFLIGLKYETITKILGVTKITGVFL